MQGLIVGAKYKVIENNQTPGRPHTSKIQGNAWLSAKINDIVVAVDHETVRCLNIARTHLLPQFIRFDRIEKTLERVNGRCKTTAEKLGIVC